MCNNWHSKENIICNKLKYKKNFSITACLVVTKSLTNQSFFLSLTDFHARWNVLMKLDHKQICDTSYSSIIKYLTLKQEHLVNGNIICMILCEHNSIKKWAEWVNSVRFTPYLS